MMEENSFLWSLFVQIFRLYFKAFGLYLTFLIPFTLLYMLTRKGSKLNYWLWFGTTFFFILFLMGFLMPIFLIRPRDPINANIATWILRKWSYVVGLTHEVRGSENLKELKGKGAIICCNHQSSLDLFGKNQVL